MNELAFQARVFILSGALFSVAVTSTLAAESDPAAATNTTPKAAVAATPDSASTPTADTVQAKLPSSVADVVKLSRAKVSEDVVLSFVQNAGTSYSLSADDIVQMRKEGVSDRVISAMLEQHMRAAPIAQQTTAPAPVDTSSEASTAAPASESAPASAQPSAVEAPLTPSGSSTYVEPYPAASAPYYGYYGPYYPYYYGGPVVAFGFGYGGCYYGHGHGIHGVGGIHGGHR